MNKSRKSALRRLCYGVLLLLPLFSTLAHASPPSPQVARIFGNFKGWDSGLYAGDPPTSRVQWLDEDTVVFAGYMSGKPRDYSESSRLTQAIVIWRLGEDPVEHHDARWQSSNPRSFVCAADGRLIYPIGFELDDEGNEITTVVEIRMGRLTERVLDPLPRGIPKAIGQPLGPNPERPCDFYRDPQMAGHLWVTDYSRRYYLDFGEKYPSDEPVLLTRATDRQTPTELPFTSRKIPFTCVQYHRFSGLFYLFDCANQPTNSYFGITEAWSAKQPCNPYWTLEPGIAAITPHCIQFNAKLGAEHIHLIPTARGMFFIATYSRSGGAAGLYRAMETKSEQVLPGFIGSGTATVSPSGCRLVFPYAKQLADTEIGRRGEVTMIALDVCSERR